MGYNLPSDIYNPPRVRCDSIIMVKYVYIELRKGCVCVTHSLYELGLSNFHSFAYKILL